MLPMPVRLWDEDASSAGSLHAQNRTLTKFQAGISPGGQKSQVFPSIFFHFVFFQFKHQ